MLNLCDVTHKIDVGFVGTMAAEYTNERSAPVLLQTRNIHEFIVDDSDVLHINPQFHHILQKSQIHRGDILIARSGSFGNAAIWLQDKVVNSSDIIIVEADASKITPCYLTAVLNSRFGRLQLERFASGAVQGHVNLTILETLKIPIFSIQFQQRVSSFVKKAHECFVKSKELLNYAEQQLLFELGIGDWSPPEQSVSIKRYSDVLAAGRLDAEYFQAKYDELFLKLAKCHTRDLGGKNGLVHIVRSIEPGSDVYSDKGIPFVRIADLSEMGIASPNTHLPPEVCEQFPRLKKNTILLSKDGSVGIAYKVENGLDAVTSSGILHLTVTDRNVLPDYLTLVLNSKIVRLQAERDAGGSIIQHWKQAEIEKVKIPILPHDIQEQLAAKVQSSFSLRNESKRLLEQAKELVERAIEIGETEAIKQMKEL